MFILFPSHGFDAAKVMLCGHKSNRLPSFSLSRETRLFCLLIISSIVVPAVSIRWNLTFHRLGTVVPSMGNCGSKPMELMVPQPGTVPPPLHHVGSQPARHAAVGPADHNGLKGHLLCPAQQHLILEESGDLLNDLNTVVNSKSARLITGIQHIDLDTKESFNSMILLGDKDNFSFDNLARYDKKHLVPFGEIVPFEKYLRPLGSIFNFPMSGFSKGQEQQDPFNVFSFNLLPVICYESIFPELIRNADNAEINGIVMVSNDGWFGKTRGPLEHLAIAKIRALELQKPILRSTNNGVTAIIDAQGNIASIPADEATYKKYRAVICLTAFFSCTATGLNSYRIKELIL